jgi:hypothetical protein
MLDIIIQNEKFANNKYKIWYINIIQNRLNTPPKDVVYTEKHHIIPKSICSEYRNDKNNIVKLTAKEHFICHLLLTRFTKDKDYFKMCKALSKMTQNFHHDRKFTAGYYSLARSSHSDAMKKHNPAKDVSVKAKLSQKAKNRKHSEETKEKISLSNKGRNSPNKGKILGPRSADTKLKISESKKGKLLSDEHKAKLRDAKLGKARGRYKRHNEYKKAQCIHCGIITTRANISRWHNANCKRN